MDTIHQIKKEAYFSPEVEVIEVDMQDWLLNYPSNAENPDYPNPNDPNSSIGW